MYPELTTVIDEARLMLHRSVAVVERLHAGTGISVPMRAVLEFLKHHGEHTVSAIARTRGVSRQHVQIIVNDLADAGLVERLDNPNHRRAPLIALTRSGGVAIDEMHDRERTLLEPVFAEAIGITPERLVAAAEVLGTIGATFDLIVHHGAPT